MILFTIFIGCFIVMLASLAGVFFFTSTLKAWTERNLKYLISFSSGTFAFVCYHLIIESVELSSTLSISIGSIIVGAMAIGILSRIFPEFHHHHDTTHGHGHSSHGARRILLSDGIHNIGDGIILASAFLVNFYLGLITTLSIFIHEVIQEISEFFLLKEAGMSTRNALSKNFLVSCTILIGAGMGYILTSTTIIVGPLLGIAAGTLLYILINDIIPTSFGNASKDKNYIKHFVAVLLGIILIYTINSFTPEHADEHGAGFEESSLVTHSQ